MRITMLAISLVESLGVKKVILHEKNLARLPLERGEFRGIMVAICKGQKWFPIPAGYMYVKCEIFSWGKIIIIIQRTIKRKQLIKAITSFFKVTTFTYQLWLLHDSYP